MISKFNANLLTYNLHFIYRAFLTTFINNNTRDQKKNNQIRMKEKVKKLCTGWGCYPGLCTGKRPSYITLTSIKSVTSNNLMITLLTSKTTLQMTQFNAYQTKTVFNCTWITEWHFQVAWTADGGILDMYVCKMKRKGYFFMEDFAFYLTYRTCRNWMLGRTP